jgi:hypothetical protein
MSEVWYEGDTDEFNMLFGVDDCMDLPKLKMVDGICFRERAALDEYLSGKSSSIGLHLSYEGIETSLRMRKIEFDARDVQIRSKRKRPLRKAGSHKWVYFGWAYSGAFDCLFAVDGPIDAAKLVLNYEKWGDFGYIVSRASYRGQNDDFSFHDGDLIEEFDLKFE